MAAIVMAAAYPGAALYAKSQLPLSSSSIRKDLKHLLPTQSLIIIRYPQIISACYSQPSSSPGTPFNFKPSTKLFVSESLRSAFNNFGELVEVNLMMDKIANRPRGFAFIRYATEEESQKAIEGMHGKFLDGRVIFVEVAKPRSELRRGPNHNSRQ
ncbi:organelle RRM domain-containing protein 6, chloroplastic-like isoform X4 [Solanum dulcamara]|uniref:organelle RRM domain-containing protein 6, chloroplastic-like isoform X4 n=1 Tax=Solanum dulcamara TaxID=45834 RepID=UPI0024862B98|nr:organelle RRM domain-containing protein 6, chloroplastic-like isoform X4 [Solanum dulcamara]